MHFENAAESHGVVWIFDVGLEIYVRNLSDGHGEGIIADSDTNRIVLGSLIFLTVVAGSIKILYNRQRYFRSSRLSDA